MISVRRFLSLTCALVCGMLIALLPIAASAEPHAITATGEYTMGDSSHGNAPSRMRSATPPNRWVST